MSSQDKPTTDEDIHDEYLSGRPADKAEHERRFPNCDCMGATASSRESAPEILEELATKIDNHAPTKAGCAS